MASTLKEWKESKCIETSVVFHVPSWGSGFLGVVDQALSSDHSRSGYVKETICVVTSDGRVITGKLVGNDQVQNLILDQAQERVYSEDAPVEMVELGLYVIRGDNVCMVGEFNADQWDDDMVAPPLPPLQQQQKSL